MVKILTLSRTLKRFLHGTASHPARKIPVYLEINSRAGGTAERAPNYGLCGEGACGGMVFANLAIWHGVDDLLTSAADPVLHACDVLLPECMNALGEALQKNSIQSGKAENANPARPNAPNAGERQA